MKDWLNDRFSRGKTVVRRAEVQTPLRLVLRTAHGGVSIKGVAGTTATVRAEVEFGRLHGEDASHVEELVVDGIVFEGDWLSIESPPARSGVNVHYELTLPLATTGHIAVANGPLEIRGLDGPLDVSLSNGPLSIEDIGGALEVELTNGPVVIKRCSGAVEAKVSNGPVAVQQVGGTLSVSVNNGPLAIEDAASSIDASASNGPISYKGSVGGNFKMRAMRGAIVLELPSDSRFELDAEADRGAVHCEFDVKEAAAASQAPLPRVVLRTERGEIVVRESSRVAVS
jgi:hypothetical protein